MRTCLGCLSVIVVLGGCFASRSALDRDGDGYVAQAAGGLDCDDRDPTILPGATELCDEVDNDCDGEIDEEGEDAVPVWVDLDRDGFGTGEVAFLACTAPAGFASQAGDCDDSRPGVSPGQPEDARCDGLDDDCDGEIDEDAPIPRAFTDSDGDGYGAEEVTLSSCVPPSGVTTEPGDCDDTLDTVNPGARDVCNGLDDDCDGVTDGPVLGAGPECPAASCAEIFATREAVDGGYWVTTFLGEPARVDCEADAAGGPAWTVLYPHVIQRYVDETGTTWGVFYIDNVRTGTDARWEGEALWLEPGTTTATCRAGSSSATGFASGEFASPHLFTEISASWRVSPLPDALPSHRAVDNDATGTFFTTGGCGSGAFRFGTNEVLLKPGGTLGEDWLGDDSDRTFDVPATEVPESMTFRWGVMGGSGPVSNGLLIQDFRVQVR